MNQNQYTKQFENKTSLIKWRIANDSQIFNSNLYILYTLYNIHIASVVTGNMAIYTVFADWQSCKKRVCYTLYIRCSQKKRHAYQIQTRVWTLWEVLPCADQTPRHLCLHNNNHTEGIHTVSRKCSLKTISCKGGRQIHAPLAIYACAREISRNLRKIERERECTAKHTQLRTRTHTRTHTRPHVGM